MAELREHTGIQLLAGGSLMLLVLLPLVAAREIELALGPETLRGLLFSAPDTRAGATTKPEQRPLP